MTEEFQVALTNKQRFCLLEIFEKQKVQIQDYGAALVWKRAFDQLIGDWDWRAVSARGCNDSFENLFETTDVTLDPSQAHVIVLQLLTAMQEGIYDGGEVRDMIEVIEQIRTKVPEILKVGE